jgi:hypothetical protein
VHLLSVRVVTAVWSKLNAAGVSLRWRVKAKLWVRKRRMAVGCNEWDGQE